MNFDSYGPFDLDLGDVRSLRWRADFWQSVHELYDWSSEKRSHNLSTAIGCYSFLTRRGDKLTPWYVGKTTAQAGFAGEIFTPHKLEILEKVKERGRGRLSVALFPLIDEDANFIHPYSSARYTIDWLEKTLIGMALSMNQDFENIRDTKHHRNISVLNILGKRSRGRPHKDTQILRSAFVSD
jgi:hypothetical protein